MATCLRTRLEHPVLCDVAADTVHPAAKTIREASSWKTSKDFMRSGSPRRDLCSKWAALSSTARSSGQVLRREGTPSAMRRQTALYEQLKRLQHGCKAG